VLLVDTSAWVEVFRRNPLMTLEDITDERDRIATCLPVIQEVLQGFDDERAFRIAQTAMYALPCVEAPLGRSVIDNAIDIFRRAHRAGVTVRSAADCLIAACAVRHGLTVWHCDRDYRQLARVAPLQQVDLGPLLKRRRTAAKR
jgi:predicted nucleic acid-binding protein